MRFALADAGIEISEALTLIIAAARAPRACPSTTPRRTSPTCTSSGWNPFQSDIRDAVRRLGLTADVHETGGAKTAERMLRERLAAGAVQIAWVDEGTLRGVAAEEGMVYHVIVVLAVDRDVGPHLRPHAADGPGRAAGRGPRAHPQGPPPPAGDRRRRRRSRARRARRLERCAQGPLNPPSPGMSLEGIARWAETWPKPFPAGAHRDGALRDMTAAIRRSGGGLLRNLQAQGLREAADLLGLPELLGVAELTADLAEEWEALAADHDDLANRVRALYAQETAAYETLQALLL